MIKRKLEKEIKELLTVFPSVAILGPRQIGKTTLAKHLISQSDKSFLYLDLESHEDLNLLSEPELFFRNNEDKCIAIDEIQIKPELFPLLRSVIDRNRFNGRFLILGSADPKILKKASESLAGRIAYIELTPFNLMELHAQDMFTHWLRGGFPLSYLAKNQDTAALWAENFVRTYIERDLPQLGLNISPIMLRNLWTMLAHNHGNIFNANNFSRALGVTSPTLKRYIHFLEHAFLINSLQPFYINIKKRLVKSPKIYVADSGILHHLVKIKSINDLQKNVIIGASWEGYVIEQIRALLKNKLDAYFYRTHHGTECDLVLVNGITPIVSIEIKYTSAPKMTKSFHLSTKDLKTKHNFIITPQTDDYLIREDVRVCNLQVFLEKYLEELMK